MNRHIFTSVVNATSRHFKGFNDHLQKYLVHT